MQAAKVMAALIAIGCASAPVVQAQTRSPRSYSKVEIDKKIDQIRRDLIAKIPTPEQIEALLGPVYSKTDVDQKLNQLNAAIPQQTVSRQDLDKALQQTVSQQDLDKALQQTVSRQDLNEAIARATDNAKAREKAIDDKLPWMPPWVAPLVSFFRCHDLGRAGLLHREQSPRTGENPCYSRSGGCRGRCGKHTDQRLRQGMAVGSRADACFGPP